MKTKAALILSCEHAVNEVPEAYKTLFAPHQNLLETHRGVDFGAQRIATFLSQWFSCDFIEAKATRLLIDCNRSLSHPQCFSPITKALPLENKREIIEQYYFIYRQNVEKTIIKRLQQGKQVLHLSIHSFVSALNNQTRKADIGLLYDPKRNSEKTFARLWQQQIKQQNPSLRVRLNYPYRGTSDGFTTALRKQFADQVYTGIEVESNQMLLANTPSQTEIAKLLANALQALNTIG